MANEDGVSELSLLFDKLNISDRKVITVDDQLLDDLDDVELDDEDTR